MGHVLPEVKVSCTVTIMVTVNRNNSIILVLFDNPKIILIQPVHVPPMGIGLLSQWQGMSCSFHKGPLWISKFANFFADVFRFHRNIFLHWKAIGKFKENRTYSGSNSRQAWKAVHWITTLPFINGRRTLFQFLCVLIIGLITGKLYSLLVNFVLIF